MNNQFDVSKINDPLIRRALRAENALALWIAQVVTWKNQLGGKIPEHAIPLDILQWTDATLQRSSTNETAIEATHDVIKGD